MNKQKQSILAALMKECDIDDVQPSKYTGVPVSTITRTRLAKSSNPTASTLKPLRMNCLESSRARVYFQRRDGMNVKFGICTVFFSKIILI